MNYQAVKRGLDILLSAWLLLLLLPVLGILFLAVCMTSPGGALFRQERVGRLGDRFILYKFRTMIIDAPCDRPALSFEDREAYLTPIGGFLRRTGLDELPQLWNVLRGDMSLVGPRPLIPREEAVHELRRRYGADRVRPGLTGLAQLQGRALLDDRRKAAYDGRYVRHMSPGQDARILASTAAALIRRVPKNSK